MFCLSVYEYTQKKMTQYSNTEIANMDLDK